MTVIYIDQMVVINLMADYLLLLCTARICALYVNRWRLALCALLGALYPAAIVVLHAPFLAMATIKLLVGSGVCVGAFGWKRRTIRAAGIFFLLSFLFAGFLICLRYLMTGLQGRLSAVALVLCFMSAAAIVLRLLSRSARQSSGGVHQVSVELQGRRVTLNAFVDTGNSLQDPLTGKHVLVAEFDSLATLFPASICRVFRAQKSATAQLEIAAQAIPKAGFRLVPFRTVGGGDLLPAFKPDCLTIDGKKTQGVLVALSSSRISDGGAYTALVGDWN